MTHVIRKSLLKKDSLIFFLFPKLLTPLQYQNFLVPIVKYNIQYYLTP